MADYREVLIGADLPLEQVAAEVARAVNGVARVMVGGEYELLVGDWYFGFLSPEGAGEFSLDVHGLGEDDAAARARAAYEQLVSATPWALAYGLDDDSIPTERRAALSSA